MIDFHTHILPGIDDGSKSVSESIALLEMLKAQSVDTVVATPHYNADHESVHKFIRRRDEAVARLTAELYDGLPEIICGAEVEYYSGISRKPELPELRIGDSKLLLMEMPMAKWTEYTVRELEEIAGHSDITLVLAHIERYMDLQNKRTVDRLYESGILMQVNASFFSGFFAKRKALSMLHLGEVHLIGSDCHNLSGRAPHIGEAYDLIEKKLGRGFTAQVVEFGYSLLGK